MILLKKRSEGSNDSFLEELTEEVISNGFGDDLITGFCAKDKFRKSPKEGASLLRSLIEKEGIYSVDLVKEATKKLKHPKHIAMGRPLTTLQGCFQYFQ